MSTYYKQILTALVCVPFTLSALSATERLPDIGHFTILSEKDAYLLGRHWLYQSRNNLHFVSGMPELQEYLDQLVYELNAYSGITNPHFEVIVVRDQQINAFAVPGGILGFHLGLLALVEEEDELASVIAHELGHISQKHYAELLGKQQSNSNLTLGALIAGVGFLFAGLPAYGIASIAGGVAYNAETSLQSIRLNETEADNIAFDIMIKSGRDAGAIVRMFELLLAQSGNGQVPLIFRTHPLTEGRISQARARAQSFDVQHYQQSTKSNNPDFFIVRSLARIALSNTISTQVQLFEKDATTTEGAEQAGIKYGLATLYRHSNHLDKSQSLLQELLSLYPLNIFIHSSLARTEFALGDVETAENRLKQLLQISPNNYTLSQTLVTIYSEQKKYNLALELLEAMSVTRPDDIWIWTQLEDIYGQLDLIDKVHYARAERYFLTGRYNSAQSQLIYARDKTSNKQLKFRINRRLNEIRAFERRIKALV